MQFLVPLQHHTKADIYAIRNKVNDRLYIGSALNFKIRYYSHKGLLSRNKHHAARLQGFYNTHGADIFRFELLELVENVQELSAVEQRWVDATNAGNAAFGFNHATTVIRRRGEAPTAHHEEGSFNARFIVLIDKLRYNNNSFSKRLGVAASVIGNITGARGSKPSFELLEKISTAFPDISMEWLIRGVGDMRWSR